jgi:carbonic anhydrase
MTDEIKKLTEGNAYSRAHGDAARRTETAEHGQHPYAVVICCSDSRVIPEQIFDARIGDLFVIRIAGNVLDRHQLGSVEYAVAHLKSKLVVMLGHTGCGAIGAALTGDADGHLAKAYINMMEFNFLTNDGFETGEIEPWVLTQNGKADELFVEKKLTDSKTGEYHYHFWSAAKDSVDFSLEQTVEGLETGTYKFAISIMGGDAGEHEVYAYVLVDGVEVGRAPMEITWYGEWHTGTVTDIAVTEGQTVTVGIRVKCTGDGNGAWGKIDDAMLNSQG